MKSAFSLLVVLNILEPEEGDFFSGLDYLFPFIPAVLHQLFSMLIFFFYIRKFLQEICAKYFLILLGRLQLHLPLFLHLADLLLEVVILHKQK